jgi:hypothetical protein
MLGWIPSNISASSLNTLICGRFPSSVSARGAGMLSLRSPRRKRRGSRDQRRRRLPRRGCARTSQSYAPGTRRRRPEPRWRIVLTNHGHVTSRIGSVLVKLGSSILMTTREEGGRWFLPSPRWLSILFATSRITIRLASFALAYRMRTSPLPMKASKMDASFRWWNLV